MIDCMVFNTVFNSSFQQYFSYIMAASAPNHAFPRVHSATTLHNILPKALAAFPHNNCQNNGSYLFFAFN